MSKALIVYGYYDEADHYGVLLTAAKKQLSESGVSEIEVVNTFEFTKKHLQNNKHDFTAPTAEWFRGHRTPENEALIKAEQDKITSATHIIFLYPIWWETLPPYMMHWVSEVFRSVSFRVGQGGEINPQWIGDRKVMIITTAGFSQEVRRDCFKKSLPLNNIKELEGKDPSEIDKLMTMAQTYPLMMALQYSGLSYSDQLHISGVDKGDQPEVVAQVEQGIKTFIGPEAKVELKDQKEEMAESKVLLLSGGPSKSSGTPTADKPTGTPTADIADKSAQVRFV
ncbi:MAG: NAD(P)H-dependent oxidoreductase [Proteobacteria bacterium]|nr:NAD(P)H-dependent oxidoreductase [Pseudomonadota bacterium]